MRERSKYNKADLTAAKALLAKSGYKGEKLTFIVDNLRANVDTATVRAAAAEGDRRQCRTVGRGLADRVEDRLHAERLAVLDARLRHRAL